MTYLKKTIKMQFNISTSPENEPLVKSLTQRMGLGSENHISRIALSYSLSRGYNLDLDKDLQAFGGKEYKDHTLFGNYREYYIALICQRYQIHKDDTNIRKYLKMHIDQGLELINAFFEDNQNFSGIELSPNRSKINS